MIPYFELSVIPIGPVHVQVWGLFVAAGFAAAALVAYRAVRTSGPDREGFLDIVTWSVVGALVGARLFFAFAYAPAEYIADPLRLIRIWEGGMSSIGGFIGAAFAAAVYSRMARISLLPHAEAIAFALPLGEGIGRIGCFLIHDHPGVLSDSFIAVQYPGGARLDHGLLLSLFGFAVFGIFVLLRQVARKQAPLFFLPLYMVLYGLFRLPLDSFRAWDIPAADARYLMLTPAQYASIAIVIIGLAIAIAQRRSRSAQAPPPKTI